MTDIIALSLSLALVLVAVAAAYLLKRAGISPEVARKACHIIVSFWVFIMAYGFETDIARLSGPAVFIIINALLPRTGLGIELDIARSSRDIGLVLYPLSLLIISLLYSHEIISASASIAGVLVMGAGDSAAAVAGTLLGKNGKSLEGSIAMAIVSFAIISIAMPLSLFLSAMAAIAIAAVERLTPHGFDNLTVPLASVAVLEGLCCL